MDDVSELDTAVQKLDHMLDPSFEALASALQGNEWLNLMDTLKECLTFVSTHGQEATLKKWATSKGTKKKHTKLTAQVQRSLRHVQEACKFNFFKNE